MLKSHTISLAIERPCSEVYEFLFEPQNFPTWAAVIEGRFERISGKEWLAETAFGPRIVRFPERNEFGVLDHAVYAEGGTPIVTPMRVFPNEEGTELVFTFYQRPGTSEEHFASTIEWITADLWALKSILEAGSRP